MKSRIAWHQDVAFVAESGSGHALVVDGSPDHGGRNLGPRPMELVLMGLGSCASFDVVTILKKQRQEVTGCVCELDATRADAVPAIFTAVALHFVVTGRNLDPLKVERAVSLSAEKYCSASKLFEAAGVALTHRVTCQNSLD